MPSEKPADRVCVHAVDRLHGKKPGALFPGFDRNKHRALPLGATVSFTGSSAADNGVVPSDQVGKTMDAVPVGHGVSDLALHGSGCDRGNAQVLGCSKSGKATFIRSREGDGPEPFDQGNVGGTLA